MLPNVHTFDLRSRRVFAVAGLIAAAIIGAFSVGGSTAADAAAADCPGSLIESRNLNVGGKKVGELDVYYNAATGKNCARMNHAGSTWGKKLKTRVWVGICAERTPGNGRLHLRPEHRRRPGRRLRVLRRPGFDQGVRIRPLHRRVSGYLWINGTRHEIGTSPWVGHCG